MSRLGKKGIEIPQGTQVSIEGNILKAKGSKGELSLKLVPEVKVEVKDNKVEFTPQGNASKHLKLWGTYAARVRNIIQGVNELFEKKLTVEGVGYRVEMKGKDLVLNVGFSHPVTLQIPEGLEVKVEKNDIAVSGIDKTLVGRFAAEIRAVKKPEPYKGKGVRYSDEVVRRKQGKKAAATT